MPSRARASSTAAPRTRAGRFALGDFLRFDGQDSSGTSVGFVSFAPAVGPFRKPRPPLLLHDHPSVHLELGEVREEGADHQIPSRLREGVAG
jgi:hypothetical protein